LRTPGTRIAGHGAGDGGREPRREQSVPRRGPRSTSRSIPRARSGAPGVHGRRRRTAAHARRGHRGPGFRPSTTVRDCRDNGRKPPGTRAEEEHHPRIGRGSELPVDRQAQHVAVETPALIEVGGPQQDSAAQDLHATILTARCSSAEAYPPLPGQRGNLPRSSGSRLRWRSALHFSAESMTAPRWPAEKRRHDQYPSVQAPPGPARTLKTLIAITVGEPGPGLAEPAKSMSPRCPSARGPTARRTVCCRTRPADTPADVTGWPRPTSRSVSEHRW
jgi:hypothetical protein